MGEAEIFYVRIKPFNPRKGYARRRHSERGALFDVEKGWYKIKDRDFAEHLRTVQQSDTDEDSPLVFDVCTEAEARALEQAEKKKADRADVDSANAPRGTRRGVNDVTRADVVRPRSSVAVPEEKEPAPMLDPDPEGAEADGDEAPTASPVGKLSADDKPAAPRTRTRKG